MDKKMKEQIRYKRENGILLDSDEITALFDYNEEFFKKKEQQAWDYINRYGGIEKFAKTLKNAGLNLTNPIDCSCS